MRINILVYLITQWIILALTEDKIAFVFELVRHGARSSGSADPGHFQVQPGMLTSSGMRQRYMLGKYNKAKYSDRYGLLDTTYNPDQIWVQCTGYFRTLQSSYSELLGMYPPQKGNSLKESEIQSIQSMKSDPPIIIRNKQKKEAEVLSFLEQLQLIPVYSYGPDSAPQDDEYFVGCRYAWAIKTYYENLNETFKDVNEYLFPIIKDPFKKAFNISDNDMVNFTFSQASHYSDLTKCEEFEGNPRRYNYTGDEFYNIRLIQNYSLTVPIGDFGRQLEATRELRKPLEIMENRIQQVLQNTTKQNELKYLLYSTHDDSLSNTLLFLNVINSDQFIDIPFATSLIMELHYDDECVQNTNSSDCFALHAYYNNMPLKFQTCLDANKARGSRSPYCRFDDFMTHYNSVKYQGDVDQACAQIFKKPERDEKQSTDNLQGLVI